MDAPPELRVGTVSGTRPTAYRCSALHRRLSRLHRDAFGSLMVHVSEATRYLFPFYTASDAITDADCMYFGWDVSDYYRAVQAEMKEELGPRPSRSKARAYFRSRHTHRAMMNMIGMSEVLPALTRRRLLSMDQLLALAEEDDELGEIWELIGQLSALGEIARNTLRDKDLEEDGEERPVFPRFLLSAGKAAGDYVHHVHELFEEAAQIREGNYADCFSVSVGNLEDARRAATLVKVMSEADWPSFRLAQLLIDDDDE